MNNIFEKIAALEKGLEKPAEPVQPAQPSPTYYEQVKQALDEANHRSREISEMLMDVQKELEQIVKSYARLPLSEVDKITERFIFLAQKKEILIDMHRIAAAEVERLMKDLEREKAKELSRQNKTYDEKRKQLAVLQYSLGDLDIQRDRPRRKQIEDEIKQIEKELREATH